MVYGSPVETRGITVGWSSGSTEKGAKVGSSVSSLLGLTSTNQPVKTFRRIRTFRILLVQDHGHHHWNDVGMDLNRKKG